ncbi:XdhC family protein [Herbaspirillum seropedicae]|uniref:XdhC family protein n=1 Tax=Herbaspirillum seropedicae TaxID=964 RepID=UPI000847FE3D|nr:XdhC family protein [Herbaspirillum seropedicae]AON53567.1 xanthine/CO dehydrogenase maturation protein [Herbaspirillum seropedicae]
MDSIDLDVLKRSQQWLEAGRGVLLATVVRTWGSAPRPVGAMLALRDDGALVGSVSGGCIEDDLIASVQRDGIVSQRPGRLVYGVDADQAHRFGLPCGGTLELVTEPLSAQSRIGELLSMLAEGRLVHRRLCLRSGAVSLAPAPAGSSLQVNAHALVTVHGPRYRLLVIGAGELSRILCAMALALDFQVTVCDPRSEYLDQWELAGVELVRSMPDDTVDAMQPDACSAVLALTHDPKLDDLALMQALKTPAFYVGALGSRANNHARRERLRLFDLTAAQLQALRGPVGIFIGSKTPAEIAISVMAEIVAVRNGVLLPRVWGVEEAKSLRGAPAAESSGSACRLRHG